MKTEKRDEVISILMNDSPTAICFEEFQKNILLLLMQKSYDAGAEFAQQWISVDDELPKNGSLCLSAPSSSPIISEIELCWFKDEEFIMKTPTKNNNSFVGISRENLTGTTTHWLPINLK